MKYKIIKYPPAPIMYPSTPISLHLSIPPSPLSYMCVCVYVILFISYVRKVKNIYIHTLKLQIICIWLICNSNTYTSYTHFENLKGKTDPTSISDEHIKNQEPVIFFWSIVLLDTINKSSIDGITSHWWIFVSLHMATSSALSTSILTNDLGFILLNRHLVPQI